ncbi:MAG: hypothetical protein DA408_09085 [Bacteroidetes bacterium]|nr:MAG: hypothetical protein DA408_09085 [Bacteroidota bacterium]
MSTPQRYPFKFLDAYSREDKDIFFGREEEVEALYEMIFQADLLLVYGASGTGKTSLIQCGLAGKFQSHDWLALNIRRGDNLNDSLEKALQAASNSPATKQPTDTLDWLDQDTEQSNSLPTSPLAQSLKSIYLQHFKPIYLIFDQFEELYIIGDKAEQDAFVETVKTILLLDQPVKIVLSIREEYLGHLYDFERKVPQLLRKKLRIEAMNLEKVSRVIEKVGQWKNSLVQLKSGEEAAIAKGVFEKIRGTETTLTITLPYLQVFLDKLYLQITADKARKTAATFSLQALQKMGNIGDVLREFLNDQVLEISKELSTKPADIWKTLSPFVTIEGTKEPLSEAQLIQRVDDFPPTFVLACLQAFVDSRILRFNEKEGRYEIAHDSLARQIHDKRSDEEIALLEVKRLIQSQVAMTEEAREYFTEKQLLFIEPYLEKFTPEAAEKDWIERSRTQVQAEKEAAQKRQEAELAATRSTLRTVRGLLLAAIVALAAAGFFAYRANQQEQIATESALKAEESASSAKANLRAAYSAEIKRLESEQTTAQANHAAFERYGADNDVKDLELKKMQEIEDQIKKFADQIKALEE